MRYDVEINNVRSQWTGVFDTYEKSQEWYNKYGKFWENRGYKLILVNIS